MTMGVREKSSARPRSVGDRIKYKTTSAQTYFKVIFLLYLDDFDDGKVDAVVAATLYRTVEKFDEQLEDRFIRVDFLVLILVDQVALDHQRHARHHLQQQQTFFHLCHPEMWRIRNL